MSERSLPAPRLVIIVVDDDEAIRRSVGRFLRLCGHEVHAFESSEAYLVHSRDADCAILDIQLPGIDGLELERRIRHEGLRLPVVFITAHDDRRTRTAVERTGRQLLVKPVDGDDLLAAIANAIAA